VQPVEEGRKRSDEETMMKPGDVPLFDKCKESCRKQGRAHYHLIECPGGEGCYEKKLNCVGARHSPKVYLPHISKKYDMLQCAKYWDLFNFEMPIDLL
jgi:hypothetical protein